MKFRIALILPAMGAAIFVGGCSNEKSTTPQNMAPVLDHIGTQYSVVNESFSLRISASDPDGDPVYLTAIDLPLSASFVDSLNGSGRMTFLPDSSQQRTSQIIFIASDNILADSQTVNIIITFAPLDTVSTPTTHRDNEGNWETILDATSSSQFAYYSFVTRDTITLSPDQAPNDTRWDMGFRRSSIILNGGVSGIGNVAGIDLALMGHEDSTDFAGFNDIGSLGDTSWVSDSDNLVIDEWYAYDPNIHRLTATDYVYIMKDVEGNYLKFQVDEIEHAGVPPDMGTITIQYIYSGSSPSFSGPPDTLIFDASGGGPIYVDFSAGTTTNPSDPRNSLDWDLEFVNYEIHQNATIFGIGACGTYEVWQDQTDATDFSETPEAPTAPQAYFADQFGSVMTDWYNYDENTHVLTSKNHVYAIRNDGHYYKLQVITYYRDIGGNPLSAYYTFRWLELQ